MNTGSLVFSQIMNILDPTQFTRCVERYPMPRASRSMNAGDQFLSMAFAQMTFREGLRDIEACLDGNRHLYAMGIRGNIKRTNLAYANENRNWNVYAKLAEILIRKARRLYRDTDTALDINEMVYALDATTIDLCLSMFPWATFRKTKSAIKLHTMIDLKGSIPVFISITEGSVHEVNILEHIIFEPGSIYVMDRGYLDFKRLFHIENANAYFVVRGKRKMRFNVVESRPVDKTTGLRCDQTIRLTGPKSKIDYPKTLRRVKFYDAENDQHLVFLTNHFTLTALNIAAIYKSRWRIELFFKWIKQNLRIKSFYGTSANAVKTQIWIAICVYLLVAILKKINDIPHSLSRILQILSVNVFQKEPLYQVLGNCEMKLDNDANDKQLLFNGF